MEDRVMSWERIRIVLQEQDKKGVTDNMLRLEAIAEAQDEISYRAGQENPIEDAEGWCDGYAKGIKEVVEEIQEHNLYEKKNSHSFYHDGGISFETSESLSDRTWWQAKLKEWGREQG